MSCRVVSAGGAGCFQVIGTPDFSVARSLSNQQETLKAEVLRRGGLGLTYPAQVGDLTTQKIEKAANNALKWVDVIIGLWMDESVRSAFYLSSSWTLSLSLSSSLDRWPLDQRTNLLPAICLGRLVTHLGK